MSGFWDSPWPPLRALPLLNTPAALSRRSVPDAVILGTHQAGVAVVAVLSRRAAGVFIAVRAAADGGVGAGALPAALGGHAAGVRCWVRAAAACTRAGSAGVSVSVPPGAACAASRPLARALEAGLVGAASAAAASGGGGAASGGGAADFAASTESCCASRRVTAARALWRAGGLSERWRAAAGVRTGGRSLCCKLLSSSAATWLSMAAIGSGSRSAAAFGCAALKARDEFAAAGTLPAAVLRAALPRGAAAPGSAAPDDVSGSGRFVPTRRRALPLGAQCLRRLAEWLSPSLLSASLLSASPLLSASGQPSASLAAGLPLSLPAPALLSVPPPPLEPLLSRALAAASKLSSPPSSVGCRSGLVVCTCSPGATRRRGIGLGMWVVALAAAAVIRCRRASASARSLAALRCTFLGLQPSTGRHGTSDRSTSSWSPSS